jgi:hypothetical protein
MLKQILAAATIATAALCVADTLPAEAYSVGTECGTLLGYDICVNYQDPKNPDILSVAGPKGSEQIEVSCFADGSWKWASYGSNTKQFNNMIVNAYCNL